MAYNFATISVTLAAGATSDDILREVERSLTPHGVTLGYIAPMPAGAMSRAQTFHGEVRQVLRQISADLGVTWSIQNGRLTVLPLAGEALPGPAIIISSATGMIGVPEQTLDGIMTRTLLNPRFDIGRTVQIDNKSVQQGKYVFAHTQQIQNEMMKKVRVADDGLYRIIAADHTGDTRGQKWYSDIICIALGDAITVGQANRGRVG